MNGPSITTRSVKETARLGRCLSKRLRAGDVVLLSGPLGAGKTAFVRGVVAGLDPPSAELVTSQSYVIVGEYPTEPGVVHIDLYRLCSQEEVLGLGYEELVYSDRICLVEWPSLLEPLLDDDDPVLHLTLSPGVVPTERLVEARSSDQRLREAAAQAVADFESGRC